MDRKPESQKKPDEPHKSSLGMRILIATVFSSIGSKLATIGAFLDYNNIVGKELGFGEKFKAVFNGTAKEKLNHQFETLVKVERISPGKAALSIGKYTAATFTIGSIVGAVLGWIQGGKFEDWRDVAKHPIKATKVVFGFKSAEEFHTEIGKKADVNQSQAASAAPEQPTSTPSDKWREQVKPRTSHADAAAQEKAQQSAASIG